MEFGLFSQHHRPRRAVADAYEEDAFEIVTADQLNLDACAAKARQ
jgi:hypothetical protein